MHAKRLAVNARLRANRRYGIRTWKYTASISKQSAWTFPNIRMDSKRDTSSEQLTVLPFKTGVQIQRSCRLVGVSCIRLAWSWTNAARVIAFRFREGSEGQNQIFPPDLCSIANSTGIVSPKYFWLGLWDRKACGNILLSLWKAESSQTGLWNRLDILKVRQIRWRGWRWK